MRSYPWLLLVGSLLGGRMVQGQPVSDPIADLFSLRPPTPIGLREQPVGPLRLPEPATAGTGTGNRALERPTARPAPRPPFVLAPGQRVLFLGDAIFEAEARHGFLESRLEAQYPDRRFTIRNLAGSPHNRLREPDPRPLAADPAWLTALLGEVRALAPDVVLLSYGTAPAQWGAAVQPAFSNVYARVVEGVLGINPDRPPRVVMLSPLSFEPPPGGTLADATNRNEVGIHFADTAWQISTNRQLEFVDLFLFSQADVRRAFQRVEAGAAPAPRLLEEGGRPTAYGLRRLAFALERGLRWPSTNWRFGLMSDGQWREGGFGAQIHSHQRQDARVVVEFTEERLPLPNPLPALNLAAEDEPHRYIQLRQLPAGEYVLRVDDQPLFDSTHQDWHRYEIIARGPSWDQAEALRQAIVRKNAWLAHPPAEPTSAAGAGPGRDHAALAELEAAIFQLKQPVRRRYEIVRTGDAPPERLALPLFTP